LAALNRHKGLQKRSGYFASEIYEEDKLLLKEFLEEVDGLVEGGDRRFVSELKKEIGLFVGKRSWW
jgi:hypothetical protein